MKTTLLVLCSLTLLVFIQYTARSGARTLHVDPALGPALSSDYQVVVDGADIPCYSSFRLDPRNSTTIYHGVPVSPSAFASFSFSNPTTLKIVPRKGLVDDVSKITVRPLSRRIAWQWECDTLFMSLTEPMNFVIDVQGDGMYPLHVFAGAKMADSTFFRKEEVIYYGPGVHDVDQVILKSNQTLFLDEGAILRPSPPMTGSRVSHRGREFFRSEPMIKIVDAENVTITGGGMITAERAIRDRKKARIIDAVRTKGLEVSNVVLLDANAWNIHIYDSDSAVVDNVKILGYFVNTDGICFNGSRNSVARNCFVHINDDGYEVKATADSLVTRDIVFEHCAIWNDFGASMGVTHEVVGRIHNVVWKNIDVVSYNPHVHQNWYLHRAPIFVHAVGGGTVSALKFENIVIEQTNTIQPMILIDNHKALMNENHPAAKKFAVADHNNIEGISFQNIKGLAIENPEIVIHDASGKDAIKNIRFTDVYMNGEKLVRDDNRLNVKAGNRIKSLIVN